MAPVPEPDWPYEVSRFHCHQCGNCCRGDGYVAMNEGEIRDASALLGMSESAFLSRYAKKSSDGWELLDQGDADQSCIFLRPDNSCIIHEAKPQQCRDFPTRWRPPNILDFCEGWRAAAGLPPALSKRTMSEE